MDVGLGELERICRLCCADNGNEFRFRWLCWSRSRLPSCLPPGDLFVPDVGPPGAWKVLFRRQAGHCSAQVTDQRYCKSERFCVLIRAGQQKLSGSDLTQYCAVTIRREGHEHSDIGERVESDVLVCLENSGQGATLCAQLWKTSLLPSPRGLPQGEPDGELRLPVHSR